MPYMLNVDEDEEFTEDQYINADGETQCVEFVRQATIPKAPQTLRWKPGKRVQDAKPGQIARGTAIATFVFDKEGKNGKYPTDKKGKHAAIYLSHDLHEIHVLDQWKTKRTVAKREPPIRFNVPKGTKRSNDGKTYYVIE